MKTSNLKLTFGCVIFAISISFAGIIKTQAQSDDLKIIPEHPIDHDTLWLEVTSFFVSSECILDSFSVRYENSIVLINAFYTVGDAAKPCTTVDTIKLDVLEAGEYELYITRYINKTEDEYTDTLSFTVSGSNSLRRKNYLPQLVFDIYPNPARDLLSVEIANSMKVHSIILYDMQGRIIRAFEPGDRQLKMNGIETGQYFLTVTSSDGRQSERVVIW